MAIIAKVGGGGNFKKAPIGNHIGRCFKMVDLGTQTSKGGQFAGKVARKILVEWELLGEDSEGQPMTVTWEGKTMPMTINKEYTLSMHEKASLRKELGAWRGKQFTDEEAKTFDITKLVGAYCMVNVTHSESNGKEYANVSGLSPLPSALKNSKPAAVHKNVIFEVENPDMEVFESLAEWLQNKIREAPEWENTRQVETEGAASGIDDSDIPF
jgi:hypothetical protein